MLADKLHSSVQINRLIKIRHLPPIASCYSRTPDVTDLKSIRAAVAPPSSCTPGTRWTRSLCPHPARDKITVQRSECQTCARYSQPLVVFHLSRRKTKPAKWIPAESGNMSLPKKECKSRTVGDASLTVLSSSPMALLRNANI